MQAVVKGYAMKPAFTRPHHAICAAALFACAPLAHALDADNDLSWTAHCAKAATRFTITLVTPSGDLTNDDMVATLKRTGKSSRIAGLKPRWYFPGKISDAAASMCDTITGVTLASGNILLLFRRDDRPGADHLAAILLDQHGQTVLDASDDLGEMNTASGLRKVGGAMEILMIRKWAQLQKDYEDQPVDGWMRLSDDGGKIHTAWHDPD